MTVDDLRLSPGESPAQVAARWLLRENTAPLSVSERSERDAWLQAHPANHSAYQQAQSVWRMTAAVSAEAEVRAMRAAALAVRPERGRILKPVLAAGLAAAVIGAGVWWSVERPVTDVGGSHYTTAIGERLAATLQDGSSVALNTNSALDVEFSGGERRIHLRRGQALFDVVKDPARPFVVYAGGRRITALGTAFDVRVDDSGVRVLLVDGRVAVADTADKEGALELSPGEQLTAAPSAPAVVRTADVARLTSWRAGRLVFQDESLADAVAELNRYTRSPMLIDDPRVAALRVSAVFRISQAERFARSMTELFPLEALKQPDGAVHLRFSSRRGED